MSLQDNLIQNEEGNDNEGTVFLTDTSDEASEKQKIVSPKHYQPYYKPKLKPTNNEQVPIEQSKLEHEFVRETRDGYHHLVQELDQERVIVNTPSIAANGYVAQTCMDTTLEIEEPRVDSKLTVEVNSSQTAIAHDLISLTAAAERALYEVETDVDLQLNQERIRVGEIEELVNSAFETRDEVEFGQKIDGLKNRGVDPYLSIPQSWVQSLREIGKTNRVLGNQELSKEQLRLAKKLEKAPDKVPVTTEHLGLLYDLTHGRLKYNFFRPLNEFDPAEAEIREQFGETLPEYLAKEYAFNPKKSPHQIRKEAQKLYRMPVSEEFLLETLKKLNPDLDTKNYGREEVRKRIQDHVDTQQRQDDGEDNFTLEVTSSDSTPNNNDLESIVSKKNSEFKTQKTSLTQNTRGIDEYISGFFQNKFIKYGIRALSLGTAVAATALTGGLVAGGLALAGGIAGGYLAQKVGNNIGKIVGEEYVGATMGAVATGFNLANQNYIGAGLNGIFAVSAGVAGVAKKKGKNNLHRIASTVATIAAGAASIYNLVTTGKRLINAYQTTSVDTVVDSNVDPEPEMIKEKPEVEVIESTYENNDLNNQSIDTNQGSLYEHHPILDGGQEQDITNMDNQLTINDTYDLPTNYSIGFNQGPMDVFFHDDPIDGLMLSIGEKTSEFLGDKSNNVVFVQYSNKPSILLPLTDGRIDIPNGSDVIALGVGNLYQNADGTNYVELTASDLISNWRERINN